MNYLILVVIYNFKHNFPSDYQIKFYLEKIFWRVALFILTRLSKWSSLKKVHFQSSWPSCLSLMDVQINLRLPDVESVAISSKFSLWKYKFYFGVKFVHKADRSPSSGSVSFRRKYTRLLKIRSPKNPDFCVLPKRACPKNLDLYNLTGQEFLRIFFSK